MAKLEVSICAEGRQLLLQGQDVTDVITFRARLVILLPDWLRAPGLQLDVHLLVCNYHACLLLLISPLRFLD
mgnify:CR=1 FL=1